MTCRRKHCERPVRSRKLRLCMRHYQEYRRRKGLLRVCSIEGCGKEHWSGGLCKKHHRWQARTGDPLRPPDRPPHPKKPCRVSGCPYETSAIQGRGLCHVHTQRLWNGLDLFAPITPGKRGRKPYIPGIPDELRAAVTRSCMAYIRGEKPTAADRKLHAEYSRRVQAWRRTQRPIEDQLNRLGQP